MGHSDQPRRWPAYALAVLLLGYAAGKAVFAVQARLGFPGGPPVSEAESESYFLDAAVGQWLAAASGALGACVAVVTVTALGRRLPRPLMLVALAVMTPPVVGGGAIMALDGFVGLGVGWTWYFAVVGLLLVGLCLETIRSFLTATRHAAH